jgi:hypothetical protein
MKVVALILFALLTQQVRPGATSTIRGVVLRSGTSTPVDKAVVELLGGKAVEPLAVTTSSNGRFEFLNVPSGSYELAATRSGYLSTSLGQRSPAGNGHNLRVEAGTTIDNLQLLMTATGAISGRVFDDTGEPLANVTVQALKYSYADGDPSLTEVKSDTTNDLGEFRLFWLPPGRYYVSAMPEEAGSGKMFWIEKGKGIAGTISFGPSQVVKGVDRGFKSRSQRALVPGYYPGTPDPKIATAVDVQSGADVRGVDFRLSRVSTRKVRGTSIDSVTGQPSGFGNATLTSGSPFDSPQSSGISPNGIFEFDGVRPGSYLLVANAEIGEANEAPRVMAGTTRVEIGESDVDNVVVTLHRAVSIEGSITFAGQATLPQDIYPSVALSSPNRNGRSDAVSAEYQDNINTQFRFPNVLEGEYRIRWDSSEDLPPGVYLKSASFGPVDAINSSIHIDQRTRDRLQIVLGTNAGAVMGTVLGRERKPAAGTRVVLVPDATHRQRNDLYQTTLSDGSGQFRFDRIPPGDYSLFAWDDVEEGIWRDAEFLRRYAGSGRSLHIVENGQETVEIVSIPPLSQ